MSRWFCVRALSLLVASVSASSLAERARAEDEAHLGYWERYRSCFSETFSGPESARCIGLSREIESLHTATRLAVDLVPVGATPVCTSGNSQFLGNGFLIRRERCSEQEAASFALLQRQTLEGLTRCFSGEYRNPAILRSLARVYAEASANEGIELECRSGFENSNSPEMVLQAEGTRRIVMEHSLLSEEGARSRSAFGRAFLEQTRTLPPASRVANSPVDLPRVCSALCFQSELVSREDCLSCSPAGDCRKRIARSELTQIQGAIRGVQEAFGLCSKSHPRLENCGAAALQGLRQVIQTAQARPGFEDANQRLHLQFLLQELELKGAELRLRAYCGTNAANEGWENAVAEFNRIAGSKSQALDGRSFPVTGLPSSNRSAVCSRFARNS